MVRHTDAASQIYYLSETASSRDAPPPLQPSWVGGFNLMLGLTGSSLLMAHKSWQSWVPGPFLFPKVVLHRFELGAARPTCPSL